VTIYITKNKTGEKCLEFARNNLPDGFELTDDINADIVISIYEKKLFKPEFLKGRKVFNFHHGILPHYRGVGTHSWAIINEESDFGVTLHEVDKGIDTGPIIHIINFAIDPSDTAETLCEKGNEATVVLFQQFFYKLITGDYTAHKQSKGHTYYRKDLYKAMDLTKYVRAFTFEGKQPCYFYNTNNNPRYLNLNAEIKYLES